MKSFIKSDDIFADDSNFVMKYYTNFINKDNIYLVIEYIEDSV